MKHLLTLLIIFSSFFLSQELKAQNLIEEVNSLQELNTYQPVKKEYEIAKKNKNEVQLILSGTFLFYKRFISSQDGSSCAFHQSCSEYALSSIKRQGLVLGGINFFDRFTRCNTCSPYLYQVNPLSGKFLDPTIEVSFK